MELRKIVKERKYRIFWKGSETGSFTKSEILSLYEEGKLGDYHEILKRENSEKMFLGEFLREEGEVFEPNLNENNNEETLGEGNEKAFEQKSAFVKKNNEAPKERLEVFLVYALCGASFINLWIYLFTLCVCLYLYLGRDKKMALIVMGFSSLLACLGYIFFNVVVPVFQS